MRHRLISIVSTISAGVGVVVGVGYERSRTQTSSLLEKYITIPTVEASANVQPVSTTLTTPATRVSEIMRFGFPSLDNIRSMDNFVLSYDKRNRTANWVFEHLTPQAMNVDASASGTVDRNKCNFVEDTSIHHFFRSSNSDYKNSGYDRGHLAAAGNHRLSQNHCEQTFLLSNMAPQVGKGFNRDAWNKLEKYVRALARKYKNTFVCTGPLYLPRRESDGKNYVKYEVIGKNNVAVPTHFFKVIVCEDENNQLDLLSFVLPNQVLPEKVDLKLYLMPVESIERAAGILMFDKIPRNRFRKINGKKT